MRLHSLWLAPLVLLCGCGTYRGIPSHGGGKRFDEEQRIVAGAIRQGLSEMNLRELRGRRVRIEVQSIAHEGSGNVNWPGLTGLSLNGSLAWNQNNFAALTGSALNISDSKSSGVSAGSSYRANPEYYSNASGTGQDLTYLQGVLEMKARHDGLVLEGQADSILFVLVDVLGTNRSRRNYGFRGTDDYRASCEITYYAQDLPTGSLIFRERQTGAMSTYSEERTWSSPFVTTSYVTVPTVPIVPLLDDADRPTLEGDEEAASQPATAPAGGAAASQPAASTQPGPAGPATQPAASGPHTQPATAPGSHP